MSSWYEEKVSVGQWEECGAWKYHFHFHSHYDVMLLKHQSLGHVWQVVSLSLAAEMTIGNGSSIVKHKYLHSCSV